MRPLLSATFLSMLFACTSAVPGNGDFDERPDAAPIGSPTEGEEPTDVEQPETPAPESSEARLEVTPLQLTLEIGAIGNLNASVVTELSPPPSVQWSTADGTIASVTNGTIRGLAVGTTNIQAIIPDHPGQEITIPVTVEAQGQGNECVEPDGNNGYKFTVTDILYR